MSATDDSLQLTATDLRMATFRLARRLRSARAVDAMSDAQLAVLATLRMHGRRTITALAERERVTAPSMTSMINGLEEQGFVIRTPDAEDRRRVQVDITEAGTEIVAQTIKRRDELLAEMLGELDFTEQELTTLREASALMRKVVDR
ncbi:DNA-binding MarR family transcriptional regulator [Microbacterium foliorum]|jgi:DNA-binding MarR family transcriptional regulator|uniref:DNA-binding MarR family transcriptional regulator n=1 Tax=Microbacterium foliorum TaxID=104336 RepID=A0ABU1HS82_9MICO|nr:MULTISPECIES: MarR family transcriptional regulator [Microbacterium]AQY02767.1 MarR family transcriptional regulator [Microbacterium foliorum]KIP94036.1 MarR family transcriptional regulator [Microbacterium sp. MEJ108Y]MDR6142903.1 DNA-binding MarR family transcriptional regulator [Microbacterium foliorum]